MNPLSSTEAARALELAKLYRSHRAFVRSCLRSFGVAPAAVDDAVHDVFLVVHRRLPDYDSGRGTMRAWLFGIALRVSRSYKRREGHADIATEHVVDELADPEAYVARLQAAEVADKILSKLPARQWEVFVMSELEGMTGPEIATTLGLELNTVYTRVSRARSKFQRALARHRDPSGLRWRLASLFGGVWQQLAAPPVLATAAFASVRALWGMLIAAAMTAIAVFLTLTKPWASDAGDETKPEAETPALDANRFANGLRGSSLAELESPSAAISGTVRDEHGAAVGRATVCAWRQGGSFDQADRPTCVTVGSDGRYRIEPLPALRFRVSAAARSFVPGEHQNGDFVELRRGEPRSGIDITLKSGGVRVEGVVKDLTGGTIEGALVVAKVPMWDQRRAAGLISGMAPAVTRSDADGRFETWAEKGMLEWSANAEGYAPGRIESVAPGPLVSLLLSPESTVSGRVVDRASGEPVVGAQVMMREGTAEWGPAAGTAFTDASGRFRILGLLPGRYSPMAQAPGRMGTTTASLLLGLGESIEEVVIETVAAPTVTGKLVLAAGGEPCSSGAVILYEKGERRPLMRPTSRDGEVVFEAVLPGEYDVRAMCQNRVQAQNYPPLSIAEDDVLDQVWEVREGVAIRGYVHDQAGHPIAGAQVAAWPMSAATGLTIPRATESGDDGRFEIVGASAGRYTFRAQAVGYVGKPSEPIEVAAGRALEGLDIELGSGGSIVGRVIDQNGDPVAGARARATGAGFDATFTKDDGSFELADLGPGAYEVEASREGEDAQKAPADVSVGRATEVTLTLPAHIGAIDGRVLDEQGSPVADALVAVMKSVADRPQVDTLERLRWMASLQSRRAPVLTDADGNFTIGDLGEGEHIVLAQRRGGGEAFAEHVEAGARVTLTIPTLGSLSGRVVTHEGEAPKAMNIEVHETSTGLRRKERFVFSRGSWRMDGLPEGSYEVVAVAAEGRGKAEVSLGAGATVEGVRVALAAGLVVRGTVIDLDSGKPLEGAFVVAGPKDAELGQLAGQMEQAVVMGEDGRRTNAAGQFQIDKVPIGTIRLLVLMEDFETGAYGPHFVVAETGVEDKAELQPIPLVKGRKSKQDPLGSLGFEVPRGFCDEPTFENLDPSGPAAAAGLTADDQIVSVDGHDVTGRRCYLFMWLAQVAPGATVTLGLASGSEIQVTAAEPG